MTKKAPLASALALPLCLSTTAALAQEFMLEEVLVTATRRGATDIQTTPIAVTAITAEDIAQLVPRDLGDIAVNVPYPSTNRRRHVERYREA